ncbi:MAG: DUF1501 domain-containing protein [Gemmataceae bacterium]
MLPFLARPDLLGRPPSRRDWLRIGLPLALAAGRSPAASPAVKPRAKSVIVLFTSGGQSQLDTWDPKPAAPEQVRGVFGSIPTALPGLRVCEHLPRLAKLANRYTVVRSMTHDDLDHGSACYLSLTGQFHPRKSSNPSPAGTDAPTLGAVLQRVRPSDRFPHAAFHVNGPLLAPFEVAPGQFGGLLGRGLDPIEVGEVSDKTAVDGLRLPEGIDRVRLHERRELATRLAREQHERFGQAFELIDSPLVRTAFDLGREPANVRDRYGRYRAGQATLLARRLVEAGVPWVTVFLSHCIRGQDDHPNDTDQYGWDTHNDIFAAMKNHLLPRFDQTVSALLEDLHTRGLLETTLVAVFGEFGRAPLIALEKNFAGSSPGRKHWGRCYSTLLAGGGVRGGAVYGASDRIGAYPQSDPVTPGDLTATLFHALGVPADTHYTDPTGRPIRAFAGEPVHALFG